MNRVTPAEREALREFMRRAGVKGAAAALGKSPHTITRQLASARDRLGAQSSAEAAFRVFVDDGPPT